MDKDQQLSYVKKFDGCACQSVPTVRNRRLKLRDFRKKLIAAKAEIYAALVADLDRSQLDTLLSEFLPLAEITRYLERNLERLSTSRKLPGSMMTFPASARLYREPYGKVLVISTWNYPLLLTLEPVVGAYAAGNQVILKMSPRSPHTNEAIRKVLRSVFSSDEVLIMDDTVTLPELLSARFDHIFITGSSSTGKLVMAKAAENLTPVTMELGGRNPCIVGENANLTLAARRIVWGKFFNAGQSCAAPDHLLVQRSIKDKLLNKIAAEIRRMYGENPLESPDLCSLPDQESYQRVVKLISSGRLVAGGDVDPQKMMVAPTVIDRLEDDSPLFSGEVFGPVLPVKEFATEEELWVHLHSGERPLAAYCFGGSEALKNKLIRRYSCGAIIFNDVLLHFSNMHIPFGGVGFSGFGAYHGEKTFTVFTHEKPVMTQLKNIDLPFRYPPHCRLVRKFLEIIFRLGGK